MAFENAIVLTGGIATGKSTATAILSMFGFRFIDADSIAHEILDTKADEIEKLFGSDTIRDDGKVDRKKLGALVFPNPDRRIELERLLHPLIREEIYRKSEIEESFGKPYIVDIPLFFEKSGYPIEKSIVVYAPRSLQIERLMSRDGYSQREAVARIDAQMDIEEKKSLATWVIDNSLNLKNLQNECERVKEEIMEAHLRRNGEERV
jgi:dephospho-CoA kinase